MVRKKSTDVRCRLTFQSSRLLTILKPDRYRNIVKYDRPYAGRRDSFYDVKPVSDQHPCQWESHIRILPYCKYVSTQRRLLNTYKFLNMIRILKNNPRQIDAGTDRFENITLYSAYDVVV